jgi:hypothetical protein
MCHKQGLPILPVWYAPAAVESKAPQLSGQFKLEQSIPLGKNQHYTLRLLRTGYLYQFDENTNLWQGYHIHEGSFFFPFKIDEDGPDMSTASKNAPCLPEKNGMLARMITIQNATEKKKPLWFAFSDVAWTKAVWKRFQDAGYRARHMRKFDLAAWLESDQPHTGTVATVEKLVAEFGDAPRTATEPVCPEYFNYSVAPFVKLSMAHDYARLAREIGVEVQDMPDIMGTGQLEANTPEKEAAKRKLEALAKERNQPIHAMTISTLSGPAQLLKSACQRLDRGNLPEGRKGVILAFDDPAGVAMDLGRLMSWRIAQFNKTNNYERKLAVSTAIMNMREAVIAQYAGEAREASAAFAEKPAPTPLSAQISQGISDTEEEYWRKRNGESLREAFANHDGEDYGLAEWNAKYANYDKGAKKGQPRYDEAARKAFHEEYTAALKTFDQNNILPLSIAHAQWLKSQRTADMFIANFDTTDVQSGEGYTVLFSSMLGDVQDKQPCFDLICDWLDEEGNNPLKRAMCFNQDNLMAEAMKAAAEAPIELEFEERELEEDESPLQQKQAAGAAGTVKLPTVSLDMKKIGKAVLADPFKAWAKLVDADGKLIMSEARKSHVARLFVQIVGPLIKKVGEWGDGILQKKLAPGAALACAIAQRKLVTARYSTTRRQFARRLDGQLRKRLGKIAQYMPRDATVRGLENTIKKIEKLYGEDYLKGPMGARFPLAAELDRLKELEIEREGAIKNAKTDRIRQTRVNKLLEDALTGSGDAETLENTHKQMTSGKFSSGATGGVIGAIIGVVFSVVTLYAANKAMNEQAKAFGVADAEKTSKTVAGVLGVVSGAVDVFQKVIGHPAYKISTLPLAQGLSKTWENVLKYGLVKGLGSIAAAVSVYWDVCYAWEAAEKGQYGMMGLYIGSAALGIAGIVFLWITASTGVGILIVGLAVAISWAISLLKDDNIQEWLGQCWFGNDREKFPSALTEEQKLREIIPA